MALDPPLPKLSPDPLKAKNALRSHFERQLQVTRAFVTQHPAEGHNFEARVRIEVASAKLASLEGNSPELNDALARLMSLEQQAPDPSAKAEAMFRRISLQWQNLGDTPDLRRENAVAAAGRFASEFPTDRRAPRLLAEAASLCDNHPEEKSRLLAAAIDICSEESLKKRLLDDRKRLDRLGKSVELSFQALDGRKIDLADFRGRVTALVFWSAESAPSLVWMNYFRKFAETVPGLAIVTVSLDTDERDLKVAMESLNIASWPVNFDGKGWNNSIARILGINSLPTLWLIDKGGRLRFLNARENYENRIRELEFGTSAN